MERWYFRECQSSCYRNCVTKWYVFKRHTMSQAKNRKLDSGNDFRTTAFRTLSVLAAPVMYLFYKFHESSKRDPVFVRKPNTEKELEHLNKRIDKLLAKLDDSDLEHTQAAEEECVVCLSAKATMQTFPCGHKIVCRKCFIKTIQVAVSQRCLPLRCVICRSAILKVRQTTTQHKSKKLQSPASHASRFLCKVKSKKSAVRVKWRHDESTSPFFQIPEHSAQGIVGEDTL